MEQLFLIDAMASNWPFIRDLILQDDPALEAELNEYMSRIQSAETASEKDTHFKLLLEFLEDTAACDLVKNLISRNSVSELYGERGAVVETLEAVTAESSEDLSAHETEAANNLARAMNLSTSPTPVPVFFATNREASRSGSSELTGFNGNHSGKLTFGQAVVNVPVAHEIGKVEKPRWWSLDKGNAEKYMTHRLANEMSSETFQTELAQTIESDTDRDLLVFMHGYNVSFDEAVLRAGQIAYDLDFAGTVVLFSWPSKGSLLGYFSDESNSIASARYLFDFLAILDNGPWRRVHVIAHSMGNRVLLSALSGNPSDTLKLGQIIFAAADVYVQTFNAEFPKLGSVGLSKTSYVSDNDRALFASSLLHSGQRVGYPENNMVYCTKGMETIDTSPINNGLSMFGLNHSYISDDRSVITDVGYLLEHGHKADDRKGLRQLPNQPYWTFR
ncbi:MAG: alpha/beta hydrolase [Pseudomonadota bacterium]